MKQIYKKSSTNFVLIGILLNAVALSPGVSALEGYYIPGTHNTTLESPIVFDNPSSQIQSEIAYNFSQNNMWGHDGKGIVFTDGHRDESGQLRLAKGGETINVSIEINTERYAGGESSVPITSYGVIIGQSEGLHLNEESLKVKVGGTEIDSSKFETEALELSGAEAKIFGCSKAESIIIPTAAFRYVEPPIHVSGAGYEVTEYYYQDNSVIEIEYSETIDNSAIGEVHNTVFGTAMSYGGALSDDLSLLNATALLDGDLTIKRVAEDNTTPVAGAKYTVEGVRANDVNGAYYYNPEGAISEFTTDENGVVTIHNLPVGDYTVTEIQAPDEAVPSVATKLVNVGLDGAKSIAENEEYYSMLLGSGGAVDVSKCISQDLDDRLVFNATLFDNNNMACEGGQNSILASEGTDVALGDSGYIKVQKSGNQYILFKKNSDNTYSQFGSATYDEARGMYVYEEKYSDIYNKDESYIQKKDNGDVRMVYSSFFGTTTPKVWGTESGDPSNIHLSDNWLRNGREIACDSHDFYRVASIYTDGNEYTLKIGRQTSRNMVSCMINASSRAPEITYVHYSYDQGTGKYIPSYDRSLLTIRDLGSGNVEITWNLIVHYDSIVNQYLIYYEPLRGYGITKETASFARYTTQSNVIFGAHNDHSSEEIGGAIPELIKNPQTADIILWAIAISVASILPIALFKGAFKKR